MSATTAPAKIPPTGSVDGQSFLLKRVQPALSGLMDGSLSTLAPIFAVVLATHHPLLNCSSWPGCDTSSSRPASPGHSWRSPSAEPSSPRSAPPWAPPPEADHPITTNDKGE